MGTGKTRLKPHEKPAADVPIGHQHGLKPGGLRRVPPVIHTGSQWRMMPHDLPAWKAVYQQTQRGLRAGSFEAMVHALRVLLRLATGRAEQYTALCPVN
jgi:transposase